LGLETYHTHVTWVWQSCLTHVYLGLINMLDPHYFGLGWPPRSCILDLVGTKSRHLGSSKQAQPCLFWIVNHVWPMFTWVWQACQFHVALDLVDHHVHALWTWLASRPSILALTNMSNSFLISSLFLLLKFCFFFFNFFLQLQFLICFVFHFSSHSFNLLSFIPF